MTKQHFKQIAAIINANRRVPPGDLGDDKVNDALWDLTLQLCEYFARENSRFDRVKFAIAAGLTMEDDDV